MEPFVSSSYSTFFYGLPTIYFILYFLKLVPVFPGLTHSLNSPFFTFSYSSFLSWPHFSFLSSSVPHILLLSVLACLFFSLISFLHVHFLLLSFPLSYSLTFRFFSGLFLSFMTTSFLFFHLLSSCYLPLPFFPGLFLSWFYLPFSYSLSPPFFLGLFIYSYPLPSWPFLFISFISFLHVLILFRSFPLSYSYFLLSWPLPFIHDHFCCFLSPPFFMLLKRGVRLSGS